MLNIIKEFFADVKAIRKHLENIEHYRSVALYKDRRGGVSLSTQENNSYNTYRMDK